MRAITLWQPWASAIAVGAKRIETRHWPTSYRGPLAIHAAKRCVKSEMIGYGSSSAWCGALAPTGKKLRDGQDLRDLLPFGAIVATCDLIDCRTTDSFTQADLDTARRPQGATDDTYAWTERTMGNFAPGRYGWVLDNIKALPEPIQWKGAQRFFEVDLSSDSATPVRDIATPTKSVGKGAGS
jgi:hypothetical protein